MMLLSVPSVVVYLRSKSFNPHCPSHPTFTPNYSIHIVLTLYLLPNLRLLYITTIILIITTMGKLLFISNSYLPDDDF